ncbi:hypothetical protein SCUP515_13097 [Seiridium cupressi]
MIVVSGDTEVMVTPRSQADAVDHVGENEASVSIGDVNIVIGKFASPSPEPDCEGNLGDEPSKNTTNLSSYVNLEESLQDHYSDPRRTTSASRDATSTNARCLDCLACLRVYKKLPPRRLGT